MNFTIEPQGPGLCLLKTETRVHATDPASRDIVHPLLEGDRAGQPAHPPHVAAGHQGAG